MKPIEEQTILITGTTSGLGQELSQALAQQGANLLLHGRDADRGSEVVRKIKEATGNHRIQSCRADLSSLTDPALENVTGEYFDGLSLAKAKAQAYDKQVQQRLAALSQKLVSV